MKFVKFKVPCFDVPDVIKEKLVCIDNLSKCLNKKTSKFFKAKIGALFQLKMCSAYCEFVDNLHTKLGVPESLFLFDAEPCVICAGIQTLKEKLSSEEPAFISEEPFPVFESMRKQEEETCQK